MVFMLSSRQQLSNIKAFDIQFNVYALHVLFPIIRRIDVTLIIVTCTNTSFWAAHCDFGHRNLDNNKSDVPFEEFYTYKLLDKHSFIKLYRSMKFKNNNTYS